jgi:hypothetical protein
MSEMGSKPARLRTSKMFSLVAPTADIGERDCHVSVGPKAAVSKCNKVRARHFVGKREQHSGNSKSGQ